MTTRRSPGNWRDDRLGSARRAENPMVLARMRSGFAVIGDTQHLPGYSLLLCGDGRANHLSDLPRPRRIEFLADVSLLGEAVESACGPLGLRRVNYEILGSSHPLLHAHVHARYEWEPPERAGWPVWCYPRAEREATACAYSETRHGELRAAIAAALERLIAAGC